MTPVKQRPKGRRSTNDIAEPLDSTRFTQDVRDEKSDNQRSRSNMAFPNMQQSLTVAKRRALKKQMKAEKSISKAAKNERKHVVTVRREDIETVARAIHGDHHKGEEIRGNPLATDKTIDEVVKRNLGFVSAIREHRFVLLRSLAKERDIASKNKQLQRCENDEAQMVDPKEEMRELVTAVLTELGINLLSPPLALKSPTTASFGTPSSGKKSKAAILQKLSTAIAEDIEHHENELKQTYQRAAGFWRYANHEILVRLTEHARKVDWITGEKVRKDSGYGEGGAQDMDEDAGDEKLDRTSSDNGTRRVHMDKHGSLDVADAEGSRAREGLPFDAYSLSVLGHRSAEGIGEYSRRNEKLSGISGHFIPPATRAGGGALLSRR